MTTTTTKHEEEIAEKLREKYPNIKRQPGSGAPWGHKGDIRAQGKIRIELKETNKLKYVLKYDTLRKIEHEAASGGEVPILIVRFNKTPIGVVQYKICLRHTSTLDMAPRRQITIPWYIGVEEYRHIYLGGRCYKLTKWSPEERI